MDVSGKGEGAGTRALLLSGALGGLLGALPSEDFLVSANDYLLQQNWEEGFATAIHLSLDLRTGDFECAAAGHPPAAQRAAGSGRWTVHPSGGPALGLVELTRSSPSCTARCGPATRSCSTPTAWSRAAAATSGSALDRMLGQAEQLLRGEFDGRRPRLMDQLGSRNDDRALVLVHRR